MKKKWLARSIGVLIGLGIAATALIVVLESSLDMPSWLQGACLGLWLGVLVLRLALTAAPKPRTGGEQRLDTLTRWPGVLFSTAGVGTFIATRLDGRNTFDALVWCLTASFVSITVVGVILIRRGDRQEAEPN